LGRRQPQRTGSTHSPQWQRGRETPNTLSVRYCILFIYIYIYVHAAQPRQLRESPSPKCRVPKIRRSQHDCTARGVSVRQPTGYVPALGCAWLRKVAGQPGSSARPRGFFGRGSPTGMAAMTRSETSTAPARPAAARGGTSHEAGSMARSRGCACPAGELQARPPTLR
jgi:hypothetical protein